jgi:hypothetical protein
MVKGTRMGKRRYAVMKSMKRRLGYRAARNIYKDVYGKSKLRGFKRYRRKTKRTNKYRGSVVKPCFRTIFYEPLNPTVVNTGV